MIGDLVIEMVFQLRPMDCYGCVVAGLLCPVPIALLVWAPDDAWL